MALLIAERIAKQARGRGFVLLDASLTLGAGEFVTVRAREPSGRTALLLVLAGVTKPDDGSVRFEGADVFSNRRLLVPSSIAICWDRFPPTGGMTMLRQIAVPMLVAGASRGDAHRRAREVLARVGAEEVGDLHPHDVSPTMLARAAVARAIVLAPKLLLANDLSSSVDLVERDAIAALLRSLTRDERITVVLMGAQAIAGADRALELRGGTLLGQTEPRPRALPADDVVVPIRRAAR